MAGGTIPRSFGQVLGRSSSVSTTGAFRFIERLPGSRRRAPRSIVNQGGGWSIQSNVFNPGVGVGSVNDILAGINVTTGPARLGYVQVLLNDFVTPFDGTYQVFGGTGRGVAEIEVKGGQSGASVSWPVLFGQGFGPGWLGVSCPTDGAGEVTARVHVPGVD